MQLSKIRILYKAAKRLRKVEVEMLGQCMYTEKDWETEKTDCVAERERTDGDRA